MISPQSLRAQYRQFWRLCGRAVSAQPGLFVGFIIMSTAAAVSEGFGISLLIPLLKQGMPSGAGGGIPWLDTFLAMILPDEQEKRTAVIAALLAVVILARGVLQIGAAYVAIALPLHVQSRLSRAMYDAMLDTGLDFFARADGGIMRTLVYEYPQRLAGSIKSMTDIIANLLLASIYVALMVLVSWQMTVTSIVLVGLAGFGLKYVLTMPLARTGLALSVWQERCNTLIHETSLGLKLIRLLGAESVMRRSFHAALLNYFRHDALRQLIGEAQSPLMTTLGGLFVCGVLIYGATMGVGLDTAQFLVLVLCLYRLTTPVSRILTNLVTINTSLDAMQRQEEFADMTAATKLVDGSRPFEKLREGIRFADVTFRYPGSDRPALKGLDLTIRRGEMIALVGASGAGKTSVVNLLGRLYDPDSGRIEIDGVDLRDHEIAMWRRKIAMVTQDITLFNMSVADNLTFGLEGITQEALDTAAARAAATEFITELPEGWDTRLGDRGVRLSGGQQQRLSIARAMLRDPELLILDEATSQLDTITERTIQQLISSYRGEGTILVVAHRLSTIRRADRIAVMSDGRVVELGSHDDLVARKGYYCTLLDAQQLEVVHDMAR
jgi:subfamily B ATP-binding cassette protein MsbA